MFKKLGITTIICITLLAGTMPQGVFADEIDGAEPATKEVATEPAAEQKQEAPEAKSEPAESTQPAADTQTPTTETAAPTAGDAAKTEQADATELKATISLLAIDPDTNNQVKWLDKEEQEIKEGATAKDLLQNVLKETKGHAEISEAGIITSISGPAEKGFANQKLVADDNYKWIVTVNNRQQDENANIDKVEISNGDAVVISFEETQLATAVQTSSMAGEERVQTAATEQDIAYKYGNTKDKILSSYNGDTWGYDTSFDVIGLQRAGYFTEAQGDAFYNTVSKELQAKGSAIFNENEATENSKTVIAMAALGKDPTNVGGYNLLEPLANYTYLTAQGINGPIWALLAFDSGNYDIPTLKGPGVQTTREGIISALLNGQHADGGWAYGGASDIDMTAMTIQALTPYYKTRNDVKTAVDKGLAWLSQNQDKNGYFTTGVVSSESQSQVIIALTGLGIDPEKDSRFVKNGKNAIDSLLSFYVEGGGFKHVDSNWKLNGLATTQGNCALTAYYRFKAGKGGLYQISGNNDPFNPDINYDKDTRTPETPVQIPTATGTSITKSINLKLNKLSEKEMKALANANHYDKATGIDLRDSKDKYLPWYVKVVVKDAKLTDRQQKKALEVLGDNSKILKTYDIKLVNTQDKKVWKPTGIVNVKIPVPEGVDAEKLVMIHIAGNGRMEFVSGKISEDNKYFAIDTTDFSVFALASADSSVAKLLKAEETAEVNTLPWIIGACGALAIALIMLLIRRRMTAEK